MSRPVLVGGAGSGSSSANISMNITQAQEGDIIILCYGWNSTSDGSPSVVTSGYTTVAELYSNDVYDANLLVAYKAFTGTPDATVEVAFGADPTVLLYQIWRGVDLTTPMDVAATTATGTNTDRVNSPAITPVTDGAVILSLGIGAADSSAGLTTPSGMENGASQEQSGAGGSVSANIAYYSDWVSGAYDPAAWSGGSNGAEDSWCAVTIALRPA